MPQEEREDETDTQNLSSQTPTNNKTNNKRTFYISALGLDVGSKRIGIAGCDRTGLIASGITTVHRTSFERDVEQIRQIIQERDVEILVVGLPYSMDGSLGFQARHVQKFTRRLTAILKLPVEYVDERLTSYQAEQMLIAEKRSPSRNKELIDRKAAALILQQWLDIRRQQQKLLGEKNA